MHARRALAADLQVLLFSSFECARNTRFADEGRLRDRCLKYLPVEQRTWAVSVAACDRHW